MLSPEVNLNFELITILHLSIVSVDIICHFQLCFQNFPGKPKTMPVNKGYKIYTIFYQVLESQVYVVSCFLHFNFSLKCFLSTIDIDCFNQVNGQFHCQPLSMQCWGWNKKFIVS